MHSAMKDGAMMLATLMVLGGIFSAATTGFSDGRLPPLPVVEASDPPNVAAELRGMIALLESRVATLETEVAQLRAQSAGKAAQPKIEPPPVEPAPQIEDQAQIVGQEEPDEPQQNDVQPSVIRMFSRPGCPPCDRWWATERPKLEAAGWQVEKVMTSSGSTPRFEIETGGITRLFQGYMSMPSLRSMLGVDVSVIQTYRPRWTNPGMIHDHLLRGHGIDNAYALSDNEAYRLHDQLHDAAP